MGPARPPRPDGDDAQLKQVRRPRRRNGVVGVVIVVAFAVVAGALISDRGPTRRRARPAATSGEATEVAPASAGPVTGKDLVGGMTAPWIVAENAMPGTDAWKLTGNLTDGAIEGYADQVSVDQGGSFKLFVSTTAKSFHVEAYRMGYYGGRGGRFIWKSPDLPGVKQPAATVSPRTNMVVAPWQSSLSVPTDKTWPPGSYLLKLVGATGEAHHVPITVRDDASTATYLLQNSATTWQAYNAWGGYDLYGGRSGRGTSFANRSKVVSFDRPYEMNGGSGDFMGNEFPLISLAESLGLDVTYWTDVDLHEHPERALRHKAIISLGHDEYYSTEMRNGLTRARDAGVNVAFLGANAVYRHIRFAPSALGDFR